MRQYLPSIRFLGDVHRAKCVASLCQESLKTSLIDDECCGIHQGVKPEGADFPCIAIHDHFHFVVSIKQESKRSDGSRLDSQEIFQALRRCEAQVLCLEYFSKFTDVYFFIMHNNEKNVSFTLFIPHEKLLRMHPRHGGTQTIRFFTGENGGVLEAFIEDAPFLEAT